MNLSLGEWETEGGRKAIVAAHDPKAEDHSRLIGTGNGAHEALKNPWVDPVVWDWSATPPWLNWIARDENGAWFIFENEPDSTSCTWYSSAGQMIQIPNDYAPKWLGDWKNSKIARPGHKKAGAK